MRHSSKTLALTFFVMTCGLCGCSGFQALDEGFSSNASLSLAADADGMVVRCSSAEAQMVAGVDATASLESCLASAPVGSNVSLPPGLYLLTSTIHLRSAISLSTLGLAAGTQCGTMEPNPCAELLALPSFSSDVGGGLLAVSGSHSSVQGIVINGNRAARLQSAGANACRSGNNAYGYNMSAIGSDIAVLEVTTKNALCGSGLFVAGSNLQIQGNLVVNNGEHANSLYSDGMTVGEANHSQFTNNAFVDNTDVDFIMGGCQSCVVQANAVAHTGSFAGSSFAAMMFQAFPNGASSGNYTDADVSGNRIDCGAGARCGIGLYLGSEAWYSGPLFGGYFHDNAIANARIGFLIDKATGPITIKDNLVASSGGQTLTNRGAIVQTYAYDIGDTANIQDNDTLIPASAYAHVSFAGQIPNWWTGDVPQFAVTPAPAVASASPAMATPAAAPVVGPTAAPAAAATAASTDQGACGTATAAMNAATVQYNTDAWIAANPALLGQICNNGLACLQAYQNQYNLDLSNLGASQNAFNNACR